MLTWTIFYIDMDTAVVIPEPSEELVQESVEVFRFLLDFLQFAIKKRGISAAKYHRIYESFIG